MTGDNLCTPEFEHAPHWWLPEGYTGLVRCPGVPLGRIGLWPHEYEEADCASGQ